jgi:cytochrome c-type biogenesis protein CcmH/NrfG
MRRGEEGRAGGAIGDESSSRSRKVARQTTAGPDTRRRARALTSGGEIVDKAATVVSVAALALAAFGTWTALDARESARLAASAGGTNAGQSPEVASDVKSLETRVARLEASLAEERAAADTLRGRIDAVEKGNTVTVPGGIILESEGAPLVTPRTAGTLDPSKKREWEDLIEKVMGGGDATPEEQQRFWALVRSEGFADALVKDLEAAVEADPKNIDARMELTSGYYTKLFTVPAGPEMGTWAAKAEVQLKEVLSLDANHWDARNSLATSYSRYPEFLNKTPDAIQEFETLRKQQESNLAPTAEQSGVYLNLGMLYMRQNNKEKAREALESGVRRHPDDEDLRRTLETLGE